VVDVLQKLSVNAPIDRTCDSVRVYKQNRHSWLGTGRSGDDGRDARNAIELKGGARRHRFSEEVSSIHIKDNTTRISELVSHSPGTAIMNAASMLAAILADHPAMRYLPSPSND
jgi:hypothetical protein